MTALWLWAALVVGFSLGWYLGIEQGRRSQQPSWAELRAVGCYEAGREAGRREVIEELLRRGSGSGSQVRVDGPASNEGRERP